jgi:5-formyltetrahydrofolate cyclo-ligase
MMSIDKGAIRTTLRRLRRQLAPEQVAAAGVAVAQLLRSLPQYQNARSLIAYIGHDNEVPTAALLEDAAACGRAIFLPRTGTAAEFVRWSLGEELVCGPGGIQQPSDTRAERLGSGPALALIPVVAWDACGTRLGRGGGFYDRALLGIAGDILRVGLAYEFQELEQVPRDPWDVGVQYVITERRIIHCVDSRFDGLASPAIEKGGPQLE